MSLKRSIKTFVIPGFLLLVMATSFGCRKYENGPWFTLRSKEGRVINSWKYELVLRNGLDVTAGQPELSIVYSESTIGFNDNKRFSTIITYSDTLNFPPQRHDGTWAFSDNHEDLILTYDLPGPLAGDTQTWVITKLREHQLWAEESFDNNLYEYRLIPTQ